MPPEQNLATGNATYAGRVNTDAPEPEPRIREWVYTPNQPATIAPENNIRTINIRQLNHGYVVEVGCQTLAIESATKLVALFTEYVLNPIATEQKYREGKLV